MIELPKTHDPPTREELRLTEWAGPGCDPLRPGPVEQPWATVAYPLRNIGRVGVANQTVLTVGAWLISLPAGWWIEFDDPAAPLRLDVTVALEEGLLVYGIAAAYSRHGEGVDGRNSTHEYALERAARELVLIGEPESWAYARDHPNPVHASALIAMNTVLRLKTKSRTVDDVRLLVRARELERQAHQLRELGKLDDEHTTDPINEWVGARLGRSAGQAKKILRTAREAGF